jgi:hypothetical protein
LTYTTKKSAIRPEQEAQMAKKVKSAKRKVKSEMGNGGPGMYVFRQKQPGE